TPLPEATTPTSAAPNAPAPTRAMPAPTRVTPTLGALKGRGRLALLAGPLDWLRRYPSHATNRRSVWLLGGAAALLGVLGFVAMSSQASGGANNTPRTSTTPKSSGVSTPSTSAPAPSVTPPVTRHPTPGKDQHTDKKKGKQ
ncbi:MAG: hypothetical protein ABI934_08680, partial [Actinomycetota bacterium]